MTLVDLWTFHHASALRQALRKSNDAFASELGVSTRTVASWNARPNSKVMPETAQILDTVLAKASDNERATFAGILSNTGAGQSVPTAASAGAQPLRVVIAVVCDGDRVLMVRTRSGPLSWQFPAGIVKTDRGQEPADVAVTETLAETGVVCDIRKFLGSRLHPVTGAMCDYFLCDYVSGDVSNGDPLENAAVAWLNRERVLSVIPKGQIYPPVEEILRSPSRENGAPARAAIAAAIIVDQDVVLLVRRHIAEGSLSWQFPAGKVEPGEIPTDAAVRETREEVGLFVEAVEVLGQRTHPVTDREMVYVACAIKGGSATLVDTDELDGLQWCPLDEVEDRLTAGIFPPVLTYLQGLRTR